ncbi:MAG: P-type conjugative transfer protein TrbL [Bradyrhizobium sp.]
MTNFDVIRSFMNAFLNVIGAGYGNIQPDVNYLLGVMIILTIALTAFLSWMWGEFDAVIRGLISRVLVIGFVGYLANNWQTLTDDIANGFTDLGLQVAGVGGTAVSFLQNPVSIVSQGYQLFAEIVKTLTPLEGYIRTIENLPTIIIYLICATIVIIAFSVLALQVFITFLEFKIVNLAALILVPFAIWSRTNFLAERAFSYMFSAGLKLFVLALIVSIGAGFIGQFTVSPTPDFQNAIAIALGSVMLTLLSLFGPRLAQALVTGGPQLGAGDAAMATGAVAAGTAGAAYYGTRGIASVSHGLVNAGSGAAGVLGRYMAAANPPSSGAAAGMLASAGGAAAAGRAGGAAGSSAGTAGGSSSGATRTSNWMKQRGGFDRLSSSDQTAALRAYQTWRKSAGPGMPYGLHSYVDYAQQQTTAENGSGIGSASPNNTADEEI